MLCKPRGIVFGVLFSVLAASTLHALPAVPQARHQGHTDAAEIMVAAWDWISSLFAPRLPAKPTSPAGRSGQQKEGSIMDPDGHH